MRRTKAHILLHFVWATYRRDPWITPDIEALLYERIRQEAGLLGADVLAVGGMPDHVHLAVQLPTTLAPARFMQRVKAVSSTFARQTLLTEGASGWQDNYAVFSFSRSHSPRVAEYIQHQKQHHADRLLWPDVEETDAPADIAPSTP